jgi:hypothetical protein
LILGLFVKVVLGLLALVSFAVFITAIVMAYRLFKQKGLKEELDAAMQEPYGGMAFIAYQINYAFAYPRRFGSWVGLQVLGMIVMIVAGVMAQHASKDGPAAPLVQGGNAGPAGGTKPEAPRVTGDPGPGRALNGPLVSTIEVAGVEPARRARRARGWMVGRVLPDLGVWAGMSSWGRERIADDTNNT